jgi:hypothetical protein
MADMGNTRAQFDRLYRARAAVGHALLRAVNSLRQLSPTMWLALGLLASGVALLITSTVIELEDHRPLNLSAAACCALGMAVTLWAFVRLGARPVEVPAHGALQPLTVASVQRPIATPSTSFLLRPAHRTDPLFRLGVGAIAMMLVGFVQPLLLVVVTVLGGMALFAARRMLARGTLIVLGTMLAIPPAGLFIGSLLAPLLGIQFGLLLLLVPVALLLLGSTAARRLTINAHSRAIVLPRGLVTRGVGVAAVVGLSLAVLVSGRLMPDAGLCKGVDAQAQARPSEAAARTPRDVATTQHSYAATPTSAPTTSVATPLVSDWRPRLIAHAPDINLLLALGLVAAIAIGRFGLTGITSKLRTELARCGNSPRGMAAVGLIGLAVLVLGESQFTAAPALEAKPVGAPASRENLADRESLVGKIKLGEVKLERLHAAQETSSASAVSGATPSPVQSNLEVAEAEAELASLKLMLARWDLQSAKAGSTVAGTVDLSTWGRADPQPAR